MSTLLSLTQLINSQNKMLESTQTQLKFMHDIGQKEEFDCLLVQYNEILAKIEFELRDLQDSSGNGMSPEVSSRKMKLIIISKRTITTIEKLRNSPGIFRLPADSQDSHRRSSALFGWESSGSWKTPGKFQVSSQLQ